MDEYAIMLFFQVHYDPGMQSFHDIICCSTIGSTCLLFKKEELEGPVVLAAAGKCILVFMMCCKHICHEIYIWLDLTLDM